MEHTPTDDTRARPGRESFALLAAITLVILLAWAYLLAMGWGMDHMDLGAGMAIMPRMASWQPIDLALVFLMWAVMMVAMMLPSAAPMILLFSALRRKREGARTAIEVSAFVGGYIALWTGFALLATLAQWGLLEARLVSPMMQASSRWLGGGLLLGAGVYQFTSLKSACLAKCQSPLLFISSHWRPGVRGALVMGLWHGVYCLGCCWLLMLLLFVLGVMNLVWIAALSIFVLVEKTLPRQRWVSVAGGITMLAWGAALLLGIV